VKKNTQAPKGTKRLIAPGIFYETAASEERESWGGLHFVQEYQNCMRKWYLKYGLQIRPDHTGKHLIAGAAFHYGKGRFYKHGNKAKALKETRSYISRRKAQFESPEDYEWAYTRYPVMLGVWIESYGYHDLEQYKVIAVEEEIVIPVPGTNGFYATMRPDTILEDKDYGYQWIMETKTTGFSKLLQEKGVYYGDQATMYLWGAREGLGLKCDGVLPDITYWHKDSKKPEAIDCMRGDIVQRTEEEIESFVKGLAGILNEISQKATALEQGYDPEEILPRNTSRCMDFFRPCEFSEVCRNKMTRRSRLPDGMHFGKKTPIKIKRGK
jgi:hypothetical protein